MQIEDFINEGFFTLEDVISFVDMHREKQEILEEQFMEQQINDWEETRDAHYPYYLLH